MLMKLLKLLVLSALLAFTANSAKAGVPDGIWTIPEPEGLEFTTFTVDVNDPYGHHYYLYNPATKMFFSSGNGWYTQASLRTFGMEIWLQSATEYDAPEGSYELWDNNCNNPARYTGEGNMFTDGIDGTWVDHASQDNYSWRYEIVDDCVRFQNVALIADRPEYTGKYLGFDGTYVTVSNTESDGKHLDAWTAILRHVDPSAPGASVDWKAVTPESYQAFVGSAGYQAYVDGVKTYIAAMNLKVTIEEAEALYIDVTAALAVYTNTESMPDQLKEAASDLQQLIDAKKKLKESIEYYESKGFTDTAAAKAVLTNPQATVEELEQAKANLDAAFVAWGTTNASVETPADMTGKITNPNFDGASSLGWLGTVPNMTGSGTHGPANVAEHWNKTFDTYQDIEGLPAGVYQLTAETSWRGTWEDLQNGVTGSKVYVKEGDTEYSVPFNNIFKPRNTESLAGPTSFGTWANELTEYQDGITYYYPDDPSCFRVYADKGWYDTKMTFAKLEEGSLRLGVALPQGVSSDNWSCFDTFTLKYFGNDVDAVKLFASEAWPFQPIELNEYEVLFTEQYLAAYNDSVDAYNPDEVTSIAYFLEKKAAVQAVYDALQANIDLWQQWKQAVDDANNRKSDLGGTEPWNMEGGMAEYLSGVENMEIARELTNEQLEEEIAKIQAMIAECEDYVTNHLSIEIPTDGLVAYYPFNGNANDVSGHGNNGTPMDNVTLTMGVHGDANGAYQFGGTDNPGHIHIPNSESLVINDGWSFATYIKPTSYNGMNGWGEPDQYGGHAIMGKSHDQHGFSIQYEITEETLRTKIGHWGDEWEADATVSGKFLNHWTHIAYTYSSNSGFCVYINGEMVCRSDKTPDFSVANTQDYYLGKYDDFWYPMNGIMDEVAIYKRALTADEVRQMAQYAEDEGAAIPDEAIDLGLPSGTKWAPWNVGASKPEEFGGYYAWGETEEKDVYDWSTYKWCNGSDDSLTKYCTNSDYGTVDNKTTLDPEDDVAHVKWGGPWKMPTLDQVQELLNNCTSEWTTQNGVEGRKFTGPNGNSIFLPAAGHRVDGELYGAGSYGIYWSSALNEGDPSGASELDFSSGYAYWNVNGRCSGQSVRPVYVESSTTEIPTDGLVAYYPFNGNANDESGHGNDGTVIGHVELAADRFGNANSAYRFFGEPMNYISVPDDSSLHLSTFTLNAWVYTDADDYGSNFLICKGRDIENGSYQLYVGGISAQNEYSGINGAWIDNYPQTGFWHMISGTVEGDQAKFYVDGVLKAEGTLTHPFVYNGTEPLTLGMHYFAGVPDEWTYPLLGVMDDVRIYNRVLSASELQALYTEGGEQPVYPEYQDGDVFTAQTIEGVEMTFKVISATDKTCQVGIGEWNDNHQAVDISTSGIVTIPASANGYSVTSIADFAFESCQNIEQVIIPEGITSIGEQGLYGCSSIRTLEIPASLTSIGYAALAVLPNLESIKVAEGNPLFDSRDNCNAIIITASMGLLKGCKNTIIPEGITFLDGCSFCRVADLVNIELPSSLESIGGWSFEGTGLTSILIPEKVSNIGYEAFCLCENLTSVNLPAALTSIDRYAFSGCPNLTAVYSYIQQPFVINPNVFEYYDSQEGETRFTNATLYVPAGTKALYEATEGWKQFQHIVEMDLEPVDEGQSIDIVDEIDEHTDIDGNVVGDIYYNISAGDGSYNAAEGCIVVTTPTDDSVIDGQDIFGEDFQAGFTGIVFKVPAGKGTVKVEAQTFGAMVLKVKIGDNDPIEMELEGRLKVSFPYNVTEPTYVYIYGGTTSQSGVRRAANEPSSLKIYGIECTTTSVNGDADGDGTIDVNDITCVAAHILGRNPANFNAAAADADGDGTIDVNDITVIAGMILNSGK